MGIIRRLALSAAAVALAIGAIAAPAQARGPLTADAISALTGSLGDSRTAGAYIDSAGNVVVTVTDAAAAAEVRAAGAVARLVARSSAQLEQLRTRLDTGATGTAWSVDPVGNQVLIQVDPTVTGAALGGIEAAVAGSAGAARIERLASPLRLLISGGDAIYGGPFRCSLGFNVRSGSTFYFLTAGHCTDEATEWFANAAHTTKLGDRTGTSFPSNDYGIVRYTNTSISIDGTVGGQDITAAGNAFVGQSVRRSGSTTGTRSGTVTGLNVTVRYAEGVVRQMIQTNVCAEPGDSGGPLYSGSIALGLTSGGSGNCQTGGTTFYQPVTEVLDKFRVSVF